MSYDVNVTPLDTNGYYSPLPILTGSVFAPPASGSALNSVAAASATPFTLNFASPPVPPSGACAILIKESVSGGDVLRTGSVASLPPSPATPVVITIPPVLIPAATLTGLAAGFTVPPTAVPSGIQIASAFATGGTFIPLTFSLPPVTVTLTSGAITVAATGTVRARQFFFSVNTLPFGFSATFTITPSGDAVNTSRVLSIVASSSAVTGLTTVLGPLAPILANMLASFLESTVNSIISTRAASAASSLGMALAPSAVISAHKITIVASSSTSGGGINLQLVLGSLTGMPIVAVPKNMNVTITPTPVAGVSHNYAVRVTDSVTGGPVTAAVTLHNFTAGGNPQPANANTNSTTGVAPFPNTTLHFKTVSVVVIEIGDDGKPHHVRETDTISPTLDVTAAGYNSVDLTLL